MLQIAQSLYPQLEPARGTLLFPAIARLIALTPHRPYLRKLFRCYRPGPHHALPRLMMPRGRNAKPRSNSRGWVQIHSLYTACWKAAASAPFPSLGTDPAANNSSWPATGTIPAWAPLCSPRVVPHLPFQLCGNL